MPREVAGERGLPEETALRMGCDVGRWPWPGYLNAAAAGF